jgi:adenylate cyclase class IV
MQKDWKSKYFKSLWEEEESKGLNKDNQNWPERDSNTNVDIYFSIPERDSNTNVDIYFSIPERDSNTNVDIYFSIPKREIVIQT